MSRIADTDLRVVMDSITSVFTFTPEKYPAMRGMIFPRRQEFAVDHSIKHAMKTVGKLAAQSESRDHGGHEDYDSLRTDTIKLVITALNLAHVLGIRPEDLPELIRKEVK